ncbi:MAG: GNAT family N-acetyltransferase [Nanoarchaeota archaeon]|nr:GNAT family N-acetyltransferase [Nanoarchaeota archaeon]MBU1704417.1 GNAT family N-acetyltransferase [Nanoarchaeota archaeon]
MKVVKDIKECELLWNKFSPKLSLFDLWDYRFCFYAAYKFEPYFITDDNGLLPLWYETPEKYYTFFGGNFPETNKFFIKDKSKIKDFLKACPKETSLFYLDKSEAEFIKLEKADPKFYLDMSKFNNDIEKYIGSFDKKHRKNLRYDLRHLEELGLSFRHNQIEDMQLLGKLNMSRFGKESDYSETEMLASMQELANTAAKQGKMNLISCVINANVESVELGVVHNNVYTVLSCGRNPNIKNLGKRMILQHIKDALDKKISIIDFMSYESGWKKLWHLEEEPMFEWHNY